MNTKKLLGLVSVLALTLTGCLEPAESDPPCDDPSFLPRDCEIRGDLGDPCQHDGFCSDGLLCDMTAEDYRDWVCVEPEDDEPIDEPPHVSLPELNPSCGPQTFRTEVELEPGESADVEVMCPYGVATAGTCTPDGTGLIAAGFIVADDGDFVGFLCEVTNDGEEIRVQTAEVTCCNGAE